MAVEPGADAIPDAPLMAEAAGVPYPLGAATPPVTKRRRRVTTVRVLMMMAALGLVGGGALYSQKDAVAPEVADAGRRIVGDENWARVESVYFRAEDRADKLKYRIFGAEADPFALAVHIEWVPRPEAKTHPYYVGIIPPSSPLPTMDAFASPPLRLPKTTPLRDTPEPGEGVWTTAGLPRSSPNDVLMAKTFIRPDRSRPYASVGILLLDSRRMMLNMVGGTVDPGGDRGVKGPGVIPAHDHPRLLVAWNGGFKGPHGGYGMTVEGREFRPMRNGLATICTYKDASIRIGEWGVDLTATDQVSSCRQNAVLLVKDGQVSKRTAEGNDTWGYVQVNSAEFITWRSAVGVTQDGSLLVATGNSLSAATLAQALWAAGAHSAMQLDINNPYVLLGQFYQQPDGALKHEKFMDSMPDSPSRFLKTQERDFMYVTLDESRWTR